MTFDICVVGAGAAGLTIANELSNSQLKIAVIESGSFKYEQKYQDLNDGQAEGAFFSFDKKSYLKNSRLRFFGGTTNHWTGWVRPLEITDLRRNKDSDGVESWYGINKELWQLSDKAREYLDIPAIDEPFEIDHKSRGLPAIPDELGMTYRSFYFSPPTRFATKFRAELDKSDNIEIFTEQTLVKIKYDGSKVRSLMVRGPKGVQEIKAKHYILACGGIENARVLLHSPPPLDLPVGRYFSDHPHTIIGFINTDKGELLTKKFIDRYKDSSGAERMDIFVTNGKFQEQNSLGGFSVQLRQYANGYEIPKGLDKIVSKNTKINGSKDENWFTAYARLEQKPNRESRIKLTDKKDAYGVPLPLIDWQLTDADYKNVLQSSIEFGKALGATGLGRLHLLDYNLLGKFKSFGIGCHHMGTTRIGMNAKEAVVDTDCKVFGTDNLFVAGSSIFPTTGYANPTFSIVGMALRLSRHLKGIL